MAGATCIHTQTPFLPLMAGATYRRNNKSHPPPPASFKEALKTLEGPIPKQSEECEFCKWVEENK